MNHTASVSYSCSQAQHSIVTPVKGPSRSSVLDRVGTPDKAGLEKSLSIIKLVHACPEEVTHQASLDLLVQLYSACLDAHLFPNLTTELYFITQLLTVQGSEESEFEDGSVSGDIEDINYFKTVHNAVYFAVRILDGQFPLVRQLDRPTLRLLSENERVAEFSPDLHTKLKNAFEAAIDRRNSSTPFTPFRSVSFQADTDNRKNFPSDRTFHLFKKQRDRFYEVLREWEAKKQTPGWNTELRLGDKIRGIVGNKTELANHLHLSRLFLSQLITTCKGAQRQWTKGDYENISSLMELRKMNPDKYLKLQDRFIRPFSCGGPCPPASFPGHQQFFHDFIVAAASPVFNQHLSNLLSSRIAELNDTDFGDAHTAFNKHQMTAEDHESECEAFANTLLMLQLLARFLGLIAFLPYQSPDPLPQNLLQDLAVVRSSMSLPLDLQKYAEDAVKRGRLALTIPWMVEFLALMDPVAPNIDFMRSLLQQLRRILNHSWHHLKVSGFSYSGLLVVTSLGWLFDQPCLPEGHFFAELPSTNKDAQLSFAFSSDSLDGLSLVTQEVFYSCCPYFGEMRYLLTEFSLGSRSKTTVRKLNLVTSDNFLPPPVKETKKDVQMELQENFFHLHPASLRRTVEFVSERTASNFIKYLRANSLPDSLAACVKEIGDLLTRMPSVHSSRAKEKAQQEIPLKAQNLCTGQRKKMLEAQKEFCYGRIAESLKLLLPEDHPESVIVTATAIACRIAKTKIQNWIHKNVTVGTALNFVFFY
ncbi:hypothetical protein BaRGS_00035849 [Batillaria attramentaria]|uniref:Codanin-1 C-terminal domain-containing protein n=1 Tax=Batillaria attramentaria TaxID=370345 RepID=A0ABD0JDA3_9CAEN